MKLKNHRKKGKKGGAVDLPTLMLADTFHDFWNCNRGQFKGETKLQALLNFNILKQSCIFANFDPPSMRSQPYRLAPGRGNRQIAEFMDLNTPANELFSYLSGGNIVVSLIEETTAKYLGIPAPTNHYELSTSDLNGNTAKFEEIVNFALGANRINEDDIHILCDAGFSNMGKIGSQSGHLRGIISPQVIGDSANTSTKPIGSKSNIYFAPFDSLADTSTFTSSSNLFTHTKYIVKYINQGINDNNPYNFSLVIQDKTNPSVAYACKFSPKSNTGPSAGLLGGCYLASVLGASGPEQVFDSSTIQEGIQKQLIGYGKSKLRATSNVVDIWDAFGNKSLDPSIFIDLKRGGDRDQVKAALMATQIFNNLIFCTGDLLCATAAIKNGLPTILQYPKTPSRPATITVWAKGIGLNSSQQWGGAVLTRGQIDAIYKASEQTDNLSSEELLQSEDVTAEDLVRDAANQAAAFIKTLISDHYNPIAIITQMYVVLDEINNIKTKRQVYVNIFSALNVAILTFNSLSQQSVKTISSVEEFQTLEVQFNTMLQTAKASIQSIPEQQKQAAIRHTLLTSQGDTRYQNVCMDIYAFLTEKYEGKLKNDGFSLEIYNTIKLILTPYSGTDIKMGHPGSLPAILPIAKTKNLYACGLVALTLINDMIDNAINKATSVATNILFGVNYNIRKVPELQNTAAIINIYNSALITFTQGVSASQPAANYLLSREAFGLATSGGKYKHKTIKHRKFHLKKKHIKTQHKRNK